MPSHCQFCRDKNLAVGRCTHEITALVCERHLVSAACNGFFPKRFHELNDITPRAGIALWRERKKKEAA